MQPRRNSFYFNDLQSFLTITWNTEGFRSGLVSESQGRGALAGGGVQKNSLAPPIGSWGSSQSQ